MRKRIQCRKVLSKSAKAHILNALTAGAYKSRSKAVTPPHMAPSPDPADYSNVCPVDVIHPPITDDYSVVLNLRGLRDPAGIV